MRHAAYLMDEPPISLYPSLAVALGINQAVILQQLHFLLNSTEKGKHRYNFVKERWWVYNSYEEWQADFFPWLSMSAIKSHFLALEHMGLVDSIQSVKNPLDRKKWYAINYEAWGNFVATIRQKVSDRTALRSDKKCPIKGQNLSDDLYTENLTDRDHFSASPNGNKKPRPRDLVFDALAWGAFGLKDAGDHGGQVGVLKKAVLADEFGEGTKPTPEQYKAFGAELKAMFVWYAETYPDLDPPAKAITIRKYLVRFRRQDLVLEGTKGDVHWLEE